MATQAVRKQMTFPSELVGLVKARAKEYGLGFQDYVRFVLVEDVRGAKDSGVLFLNDATEKRVGKSIEDIKKGDYKRIRNKKDLYEQLDSDD